jgi:soluble lytic murein transglycosylase-like protein
VKGALGPLFAVILIQGCAAPPSPPPADTRLETLAQAFAQRFRNPAAAAGLFAEAGSGPSLESARQRAWFAALDDADAAADRWLDFIDARPSPDLEARAVLRLAAAYNDEGKTEKAVETLVNAPSSVRHRADVELLDLGGNEIASDAAGRLARSAPQLLRNRSRTLEQAALAGFSHRDWMRRAAAWRSAGLGSRGAAELRSRRSSGAEELERRKELARCELDAGSSTRALNALPARRDADPEALVLRAEAYRRQGWGRFPDRAARRSFSTCLDEARQAAASTDNDIRGQALVLWLECATESGQPAAALEAWRRLETSGWRHPRRGWLGRRLGVALARNGSDPTSVAGMKTSLPAHARCLSFWQSTAEGDSRGLSDLASSTITDLYAHWAVGTPGVSAERPAYTPPPAAGAAPPPPAVAWLLDHAGPVEASAEWQRLFDARLPTPAEAMTAASQAVAAGRANTAIRSLRIAFPGISSIALAEVPEDAARIYLPLRFTDSITRAAAANSLDPWLIAAVARQESTFVTTARSPAGARGVLQLLPSTARLHSSALGLGRNPDLFDPEVNIRIGARELAALMRRYGAVEPALAAYNAGDRRVRRWWKQWPDHRLFAESIPIPETYTYVRRVVFLADAYRQVHADVWKETP